MVLALGDEWVWDSWYLKDGDNWHAYFLKAQKSLGDPERRHWNVSLGHAIGQDLKDWTYLGTCFAPAKAPAWDDFTTWTGCTLRDDNGGWHLFYTGTSTREDGLYQRIGHAISDNGHDWQRVGEAPCLDLVGPKAKFYESVHQKGWWPDRAMRDPWVMKNPSGAGWLMYFTARAPDIGEANDAGAIGFATSPDLYNWELQPPIFVGGFGQLEVPQIFTFDGRWYGLFCTADRHFSKAQSEAVPGGPTTGTHYLMVDRLDGPWRIAPGPFLDGSLPCERYAARIVEQDGGLVILGFADQKDGAFVGRITDPDPVRVDENGYLNVEPRNAVEE